MPPHPEASTALGVIASGDAVPHRRRHVPSLKLRGLQNVCPRRGPASFCRRGFSPPPMASAAAAASPGRARSPGRGAAPRPPGGGAVASLSLRGPFRGGLPAGVVGLASGPLALGSGACGFAASAAFPLRGLGRPFSSSLYRSSAASVGFAAACGPLRPPGRVPPPRGVPPASLPGGGGSPGVPPGSLGRRCRPRRVGVLRGCGRADGDAPADTGSAGCLAALALRCGFVF